MIKYISIVLITFTLTWSCDNDNSKILANSILAKIEPSTVNKNNIFEDDFLPDANFEPIEEFSWNSFKTADEYNRETSAKNKNKQIYILMILILSIPCFLILCWFIIKKMIYSIIYTATKAIRDAKKII